MRITLAGRLFPGELGDNPLTCEIRQVRPIRGTSYRRWWQLPRRRLLVGRRDRTSFNDGPSQRRTTRRNATRCPLVVSSQVKPGVSTVPSPHRRFRPGAGPYPDNLASRREITPPESRSGPHSMLYPCTGIPSVSLLGTFWPLLNSKHMEVIGPNLPVCERFRVRTGSEKSGRISLLGSASPARSQQAAQAGCPR